MKSFPCFISLPKNNASTDLGYHQINVLVFFYSGQVFYNFLDDVSYKIVLIL